MVGDATKYTGGFKDFDKLLDQLPIKVEGRVVQNAVNAAARVGAKSVRASAPIGSGEQSEGSKVYGHLSKNIKVRVNSRAKKRGLRSARITIGNAFWGRFLEFGTRFISARPWFRPAFLRSHGAMVEKLGMNIGRGIEREAKKLAGPQNGDSTN